jgi:hypothetical protein
MLASSQPVLSRQAGAIGPGRGLPVVRGAGLRHRLPAAREAGSGRVGRRQGRQGRGRPAGGKGGGVGPGLADGKGGGVGAWPTGGKRGGAEACRPVVREEGSGY